MRRFLKVVLHVLIAIAVIYLLLPRRARAQVNTFAASNFGQTWKGIQKFIAGLTILSIDNSLYVDGVKYTTVQAAVTAACASGGVVLVPQGTYVGPTTLCSNLTIKAFNMGYLATPTIFTYTAPLSIANFNNLDIEGIQFDFGSSGGLTLSSISASRIDLEVVTTQLTAPALTITCTVLGGNTAYNQFERLVVNGGLEGIQFKGLGGVTPTCAVTENQFGMLQAFAPAYSPASTWTAFDVVQDADSDVVQQSHMYNLAGPLTAGNGWSFNSSSAATMNDSQLWTIGFFDSTSGTITGCGITGNQSAGISIKTGVFPWSGGDQFCLGSGATPSIDWQALNSSNVNYFMSPVVWGAAQPQLNFSSGYNSGVFAALKPASGFINGTAWTLPAATGTVSLGGVEYCGATSGSAQACAKTVEKLPLIIYGDVTLNSASSQSITTLPFTAATYSCSGSDLTNTAGIVSFNTYANASVTIAESGGGTSDHLRWTCVGY